MKIDNNNDLLDKTPLLSGMEYHPVAFEPYRSIILPSGKEVDTILDSLKEYHHRRFIAGFDNYGVEVSVNYNEGVFVSMILKGTGEQGEGVIEPIATMLVPKEAKSKNKITMHAQMTVLDKNKFQRGMLKEEIPSMLRDALRNGFKPYEDKNIVIRAFKLFIDDVLEDPYNTWQHIGNMTLTGLSMGYDYEALRDYIKADLIMVPNYLLPQKGIILSDEHPNEEGAYPTTRFLFEEPISGDL